MRSRATNRAIAVIGAGRAASALAVLLKKEGWTISAVAAEHSATARRLARRCGAKLATTDPAAAARSAPITLIAVSDRAIPDVAARIARSSGMSRASNRSGARSRIALHTSGAAGAEILRPLRRAGWATGSLHPLISFPPAGARARSLEGVSFAIDGDPAAVRTARRIAASLRGVALELPANKRARYHLAACLASNYVVALIAEAEAQLHKAGVSPSRVRAALVPLIRSTLDAVEAVGPRAALTGPVARGDAPTIRRHAELLAKGNSGAAELHRQLVLSALRLASVAGRIAPAARRAILRTLHTTAPPAASLGRRPVRGSLRAGNVD